MTTKEKLQLIEQAYDALAFINNKTWTPYRERLFEACLTEEKKHRGFLPEFARDHTPDTIIAAKAARMFAVKRVAEYLIGRKYPKGRDALHLLPSCFYAAGIADEFRAEIRKAWRKLPMAELTALDYCEFVKVKQEGSR